MLRQQNAYVQAFVQAIDVIREHPATEVRLQLRTDCTGFDRRRYNAPVAADVAVILPGSGETAAERDLIVQYRAGGLRRVRETARCYEPLHYVLLFPRGETGWCIEFRDNENRKVSLMDFLAYRIQCRPGVLIPIAAGRLFHEYVVDGYARVDQQRVSFLKYNQRKVRAELYQGVVDAVAGGEMDPRRVGRRIVLPAGHLGSPRSFIQLYQNAMAIVRVYGRPDYFITFTCNPKWREIQDALLPGQQPNDRPDLIVRVFRLKLQELFDLLFKKHVLGHIVGAVWVLEHQKRSLPHVHMVCINAAADKMRTPDDYNNVVCAEIPNKQLYPAAYETVRKCMIHGPCGADNPNAPCMTVVKGVRRCSKRFPKPFTEFTTSDDDGYPRYQRRDDGRRVQITRAGNKNYELDNRYVVPYNRYLLERLNAHINVEVCSTLSAVKYLYKYVYKGPDRAVVQMRADGDIDEIGHYMDARWVSSCEAIGRIYGFKIHRESPAVLSILQKFITINSSFVI